MQPNAARELLAIRLKATGIIQMQLAAALAGKGQDELQAHFIDSSKLLIKAARELTK